MEVLFAFQVCEPLQHLKFDLYLSLLRNYW